MSIISFKGYKEKFDRIRMQVTLSQSVPDKSENLCFNPLNKNMLD